MFLINMRITRRKFEIQLIIRAIEEVLRGDLRPNNPRQNVPQPNDPEPSYRHFRRNHLTEFVNMIQNASNER
jgi:hypothetical protein